VSFFRRNKPWIVMAVGLAWCIAAVAAHAQQQPTAAEMQSVLTAKLGLAQQSIDQALLALTRAQEQNKALAEEVAHWKEYARPLYEPAPTAGAKP